MRLVLTGCVIWMAMFGAPSAHASTGGATRCEVLGWDAVARQVWVHIQPEHEGYYFGEVLSFDLGSAHPTTPSPAGWNHPNAVANDPSQTAHLAMLRATLEPLTTELVDVLPATSEVIELDSLWLYERSVPRYRVRANFDLGVPFEVTTFNRPDVARRAIYFIPGTFWRLEVLTFIGDPVEGGYQTDVPVLVHRGEHETRVVEFRRFAP